LNRASRSASNISRNPARKSERTSAFSPAAANASANRPGIAAFKKHLSYLPHSGSVFPQLPNELEGYVTSTGALRFAIDKPLPVPLVQKLITVRLQQAFPA
jgi:hypothetical protein